MEQDLVRCADLYAAARGISRSRLSTILFNGGRILDRVANGKGITVRLWQNGMRWLSRNWPADLTWPAGIARPDPFQDEDPVPAARNPKQAA